VKIYTIRLDSVRNKVFLFGFVAAISRILGAKYCDLVCSEDGEDKVNRMKDILCVAMEVNDGFLVIETLRVGNLHVGNLLAVLSQELNT
jgi:hypothetical protein